MAPQPSTTTTTHPTRLLSPPIPPRPVAPPSSSAGVHPIRKSQFLSPYYRPLSKPAPSKKQTSSHPSALDIDITPLHLSAADKQHIQRLSRPSPAAVPQNGSTSGAGAGGLKNSIISPLTGKKRVLSPRQQALLEHRIVRERMLVNLFSERWVTSLAVVPTRRGSEERLFPRVKENHHGVVGLPEYWKWMTEMVEWLAWRVEGCGYVDLVDPFLRVGEVEKQREAEKLLKEVERVVFAWLPLYEWWNRVVRPVYMWEDKIWTARCLGIAVVLWRIGWVGSFCLAYAISKLLRNREDWKRLPKVRSEILRVRDRYRTTRSLLSPLEPTLLPFFTSLSTSIQTTIRLTLTDLADTGEIIQNLHEHRANSATITATLFLLLSITITMAFTSHRFLYRLVLFSVLSWFFTAPLAISRFPRYRRLFYPITWLAYNIPTNTGVVVDHYRRESLSSLVDANRRRKLAKRKKAKLAARQIAAVVAEDKRDGEGEGFADAEEGWSTPSASVGRGGLSDADVEGIVTSCGEEEENDGEVLVSRFSPARRVGDDGDGDGEVGEENRVLGVVYCAFLGRYLGVPGRVNLCEGGVVFLTEVGGKVTLVVKWEDLRGLAKGWESEELRLRVSGGEVLVFEGLKGRDKAFGRVVGLSGLRWKAEQW